MSIDKKINRLMYRSPLWMFMLDPSLWKFRKNPASLDMNEFVHSPPTFDLKVDLAILNATDKQCEGSRSTYVIKCKEWMNKNDFRKEYRRRRGL